VDLFDIQQMLGEGGPVDKTKDMKMCAYKQKKIIIW